MLLALETSTRLGSVALLDADGRILRERTFRAERNHSAALFEELAQVLDGMALPRVIAVGLGPGAYAGVRVAIAAAIGLRIASGAELRGVASIAALPSESADFHVIGDARRTSFYLARIKDGRLRETPLLFPMDELAQHTASLSPLYVAEPFAAAENVSHLAPSAVRVGRLALHPEFSGPRDELEPIYLREPHITPAKRRPLRP